MRYANFLGFLALAASPGVAAADLLGIDVSTHQGSVSWTAMKNAGVSFGFAKATEGVDFIDTQFVNNMNAARTAGVPIGPYHYGRPDSSVGTLAQPVKTDAVNEANDFVDAIQPYYTNYPDAYLRPVLDLEELPLSAEINTIAEQKTYLSAWVRDFNAVVQDRLGVDVILYLNGNYAQNYLTSDIATFDLWFAKPSATPPTAANLGIWDDWVFWQHSWTGNLGGENPLDLNTFRGTTADLAAYFFNATQPLEGDFNGDGLVNAADYTVWRDVFPTSNPGHPADANGNGVIDVGDRTIWAQNYGRASGAAALAVPEPTAALAAAVCGLAALRRR